MDEHRTQLVAAAQAMCVWVRAQRATWTEESGIDFSTLRGPAFPSRAGSTLVTATFEDVTSTGSMFAPEVESIPFTHPAIDLAAHADTVRRAMAAAGVRVASLIGHSWKPALGAASLAALVWTGRVYGPGWSGAIKRQLAAAGSHVTVFDRSATVPPAATATGKPGERALQPKKVGRLQVDSNPAGVHVVVDGRDRGATPLTLTDLPVGFHVVVLKGDEGSVQRTVTVTADKTTQLNEAIYSGWLHVSSPIELQISEGTQGIRLDESNQVLLPPGQHEVRFANSLFGFVDVRTLQVRPGGTTSISIEPPASKLSITTNTPAEVLVDGVLVGGTPLSDFPLAVGTREITVRNAAGAERRSMTTVTVEPLRLDIDFSKP